MFLFLLYFSCSNSSENNEQSEESSQSNQKKKGQKKKGQDAKKSRGKRGGSGRRGRGGSSYGDWGGQKQEESSLLVESELVSVGNVSSYLQLTGTLESEYAVSVVPEMTGTCSYVYVREGDQVKKGDSLAQITNRSVDASAQRAGIELERAKREYEKIEVLYKKGVVSSRDYQEAKTAFRTAQTSFEEAQKNKGATTILSPIDGVVSIVSVQAGEQIGATQAFQLIDPLNLRLIVAVPERDLVDIHTGQSVEIFSAYNESQNMAAEVERIGPIVDPTNGSVKLFIDLPPLDKEEPVFRAGQFVRAEVELDTHRDTKIIPKSALIYQDGQPIVYQVALLEKDPEDENKDEEEANDVVEEKGWFASLFGSSEEEKDQEEKNEEEKKQEDENQDLAKEDEQTEEETLSYIAQKTEIELGYIDTKVAEVLSGLEIGDEIVTIGNTNLRQGTPIRTKSNSEDKDVQETVKKENTKKESAKKEDVSKELAEKVKENEANKDDNSSKENKQ